MIELRSADLFHVAFALAFRRKAKQKIFVCSRALALNYRWGFSPTTSFNYNYSTRHDITYKEQDRGATKIIYYPCFITEVLSPGTEAISPVKSFKIIIVFLL